MICNSKIVWPLSYFPPLRKVPLEIYQDLAGNHPICQNTSLTIVWIAIFTFSFLFETNCAFVQALWIKFHTAEVLTDRVSIIVEK